MSSRSAAAYQAYLADWQAKHPNIVQPEYVSYWDALGRELAAAWSASTDEVASTVWQRNGARDARVLPDGRCVERWHDSRGNPLFAVFPSLDAQQAFDKPHTYRTLYEQW